MDELGELTEDERDLVLALREGHGIILNCDIGHGVSVEPSDDEKRFRISVHEDINPRRGPAVRSFMQKIVTAWSAQLRGSSGLH